jgi:hypothetical protein
MGVGEAGGVLGYQVPWEGGERWGGEGGVEMMKVRGRWKIVSEMGMDLTRYTALSDVCEVLYEKAGKETKRSGGYIMID